MNKTIVGPIQIYAQPIVFYTTQTKYFSNDMIAATNKQAAIILTTNATQIKDVL